MWMKYGLLCLLALSGYLYAGDIELTIRAEKESTINVNGEILTVRQPVKRINVGDELTLVLNYTNTSDDDTFNIHIDNPIPAGTRFVLGSGCIQGSGRGWGQRHGGPFIAQHLGLGKDLHALEMMVDVLDVEQAGQAARQLLRAVADGRDVAGDHAQRQRRRVAEAVHPLQPRAGLER